MITRPNRRNSGTRASLKAGLLLSAAMLAVALSGVGEARAFSLFGVHLWGEREEEIDNVQDPVRYHVTFSVTGGDDGLERFLRNRSELVNGENQPVDGDLGLLVKARDDLQILVGSLFERAYYGGLVNISIEGQNIEDIVGLPNFDRVNPVPVTVNIEAGPRFTFANIDIKDAPPDFDPAKLGLVIGTPAYSTTILSAAQDIVSKLKDDGHPFARITKREVIANHENATINVLIDAEAGPKADLGPIAIKGADAVDPEFIRTYSRLKAGEPYSPQELTDAANRLRTLKTFDSVVINTGDTLDENGQLPTTITVKDGKFRYFGFGATVSSIDGLGLEGYWGHRNLFGHAEGLRLEAGVSRIGVTDTLDSLDYAGGITFTRPGLFHPSGMFTASLAAGTENPDPYNAKTVAGSVTYSYEQNDYNTITLGSTTEYSHIEDAFGTEDYLTFSLPVGFDRDTRNDALNPTEGIYLVTTAEPAYDFLNGTVYSSFDAVGSTYFSAGEDDRFTLAARLGAGTIVGGDSLEDIPANQRFYAGGGGSVRGYAYKSISPRNANGDETGGRSYVEATLEARIGITENIQVVPFIDAADVSADNFPDFSDIRAGAGVGVRYLTGFGPIRLDVALPLDRYPGGDRFGIYAGIGQSF
ncbi:autotransporter assembly complex family protein [Martelella sp. AD-3]|uniref:autotransporter assembly complex protein TamA n=1 Tax=Martelella sp. AD-3 TaxID=686597 RepID=UPI0004644045|nr:autotransporter assembly complex family protein [Martelella sp. AD-3]MAM13140.1 outer membrane protein assembly factor [Rhizobiaceae bacterium]